MRSNVKLIVSQFAPKIDELIALYFVANILKMVFRYAVEFTYCVTRKPSFKTRQNWENMDCEGKPILVDVGNNKYHGKANSTLELIGKKYAKYLAKDKVFNTLLKLVNNNNRTGELKSYRFSLAAILRKVCYLPSDGIDTDTVREKMFDVIRAYYPLNLKARDWSELYDDANAELRTLWESFNMKSPANVQDLTIPKYFVQLFLGGATRYQILEKVSWWMDIYNRIEEAKADAAEKIYIPEVFVAKGFVVMYIEVDNRFQTEAFTSDYIKKNDAALAIVKLKSTGHVLIQTNFAIKNLDLTNLYDALNAKEQGQWYLEKRFAGHLCMNGTAQFTGVKPTQVTFEEFKQLCEKHVAIRASSAKV